MKVWLEVNPARPEDSIQARVSGYVKQESIDAFLKLMDGSRHKVMEGYEVKWHGGENLWVDIIFDPFDTDFMIDELYFELLCAEQVMGMLLL